MKHPLLASQRHACLFPAKSPWAWYAPCAETSTVLWLGRTQNAWDTNDITRMLRPYDMDYAEIGRIRMETGKLLTDLLK